MPKESVLLDCTRNTEAVVLSEMLQGTVLWPLLFLAFINDLPESTKRSDARLFACLLYRQVLTSQDSALLQEDLSALERWEEIWQMKFRPEKWTVIRLSTNRQHIIKTNYQIHGHTLEVVDSSKYLDIWHYQRGPHMEKTYRKHSQQGQQNTWFHLA